MPQPPRKPRSRPVIGWREWLLLPDLFPEPIKVKVDTGAQTSALHAFRIREFVERGARHVSFLVHPLQHKRRPERSCTGELIDVRQITSSNGAQQQRYVIATTAQIGTYRWPIEMTLTNRDMMSYRMLLGREAVRRRFLVDPGRSFLQLPPDPIIPPHGT